MRTAFSGSCCSSACVSSKRFFSVSIRSGEALGGGSNVFAGGSGRVEGFGPP